MERRFWLGVGLLALVLVLGLWVMFGMARIHEPVSDTLDQAAREALDGDWDGGVALAKQAKATWEDTWHGTAVAADHSPMDEIDGLFAELEVYAQAQERTDFAACCAHLSALTRSMSDAHSLTWWNLL